MSRTGRVPDGLARARSRWRYTGAQRPGFAVTPGEGQESVWDYPRPPRCEADAREVVVRAGDEELARSTGCVRVLETASPPTFYLAPPSVRIDRLEPRPGRSHCEWKGEARYWGLRGAGGSPVAWSYPAPFPEFESIRDWLAFYPARVACFVDGVRVEPQPGDFYGGWVTPELVGPFKGEPGSESW